MRIIQSLFSSHGPLKTCRIHWDKLGRSKGTAVVEYENVENAAKAIEMFDGAAIDGVPIKVEYDPMVKKKM